MKRQYLLLQALAKTDKRVKLIIAGPPDSPADAAKLIDMVQALGVADRVRLDLRFLPRATYVEYVNGAMAVAYIPFDEEMGYVTMEAATASKALITTNDSGGVLALVKDRVTGWVAEPTVESLAAAMSAVVASKSITVEYGAAANALWNSLGVNWNETIEALLK
jgi:glycosyltransferase involved in cell wall biosynthesis